MARTYSRRIAFGSAVAAFWMLLVGATAATAAEPTDPSATGSAAAPQVSIDIDNGKTSVLAGDTLTYTITLQNLGTTDIVDLTITQTVPLGLEFGSADNGGVLADGAVSWAVDVPTATSSTLQTTMTVTETPPELLRLATVACATADNAEAPLVCASHSDQLPAGAVAESAAAATAETATDRAASSSPRWAIVGGVVLVLLVGVGAALSIRARRRTT